MEKDQMKEKVQKKNEVYKTELERLFKKNNGELTPQQLVVAARAKSSPLHDYFNWEDSEAARLWRLHQARLLFGYVKVDLGNIKIEQAKKIRIAINVTNKEGESVYVPTMTAVQTKDYATQLITEIMHTIETLSDKLMLFRTEVRRR